MTSATIENRVAFIWDAPSLLGYLHHTSIAVQEWAARRVLRLYPEVAGEALQALPRVSPSAASSLLSGLERLPLPPNAVPALRDFLKRPDAEPHGKALAAALLLRENLSLPEDVADVPLWMALPALCRTDTGLQIPIEQYGEQQGIERAGILLDAVSQELGLADLSHIWESASRKERRRHVQHFEKEWGRKLPPLHEANGWDAARRLLRETLETVPAPDSAKSRFPVLAAETWRTRQHINALLDVMEPQRPRETAGASGGLSQQANAMLSCVLILHRDAACLETLDAAAAARELWRSLALRPWKTRELDSECAALLRDEEPENVLASLRAALPGGWAYCDYPFALLRLLSIPGRHRLLMEAWDGAFGESCAEEAAAALENDPAAVTELIREWREQLPDIHNLGALIECPTREAVEFLLESFDHYMRQSFSSLLAEVVEGVGASAFLDPLLREWREGEKHMERAVWFLAELHGLTGDSRVLGVPRHEPFKLPDPTDDDAIRERLEQGPTRLPLRCTACGRTYHYQVERVYVDKNCNPSLGQIIQCKGCGSLETYELTGESHFNLTVETVRLAMLTDGFKGHDTEVETPLMAAPLAITAGGKRFRTISEAYHFLRDALDRDPANSDLQLRVGNVLKNGLRPDLAIPHYQEAIRLNPNDAESLFSLADAFLEAGRPTEAIPHTEELAAMLRALAMDEDAGRDLLPGLMHLVASIEAETGRKINMFVQPKDRLAEVKGPVVLDVFSVDLADTDLTWRLFRHGQLPDHSNEPDEWMWPNAHSRQVPARVTKVGRNQACPCGSGKKYKRCCGQ